MSIMLHRDNMVEEWFGDFKLMSCRTTRLRKRGGDTRKPKKLHKIVSANRIVKLQKIDDTLRILRERVGFIVHEHL